MSVTDVRAIIGSEGKLLGNEDIDGMIVPNQGEQVYYWMNKDGSYVSVAVLDDKVTTIVQYHLH